MKLSSLLFVFTISIFFTACDELDKYLKPQVNGKGTLESPVDLTLDNIYHSPNRVHRVHSYYQFTTNDEGYYAVIASSNEDGFYMDDFDSFLMDIESDKNLLKLDTVARDRRVAEVKYLKKQTTYYIETYSYTDVAFDLLITSPPEYESLNSSPVNLNTEETHYITTGAGHYYYTFTINNSGYYSIKAKNLFSVDSLFLELNANDFNNTSNSLLASSYSTDYLGENKPINIFLEPGTYYVRAINFSHGIYDLHILSAQYEEETSIALSIDETVGLPKSYLIDEEYSYYSIDIASDGNYSINLDNYHDYDSDGSLYLNLYANVNYYLLADGYSYYYKDDNSIMYTGSSQDNFRYTNIYLQAGTYYLKVKNDKGDVNMTISGPES